MSYFENTYYTAVENNDEYVVRYIVSKDLDKITKKYILFAIRKGNLKIIKLLLGASNINYKSSYDLCHEAAEYGHLECLKYLQINDYILGPSICANAAKNGLISKS